MEIFNVIVKLARHFPINNRAANIKDFSRSRATIRLGRDTLESVADKRLAESFSQAGTTNEHLLLCESKKEVEGWVEKKAARLKEK